MVGGKEATEDPELLPPIILHFEAVVSYCINIEASTASARSLPVPVIILLDACEDEACPEL